MSGTTRCISQFVVEATFESLPSLAVEAAKLRILDILGCTLAGSQTSLVKTAVSGILPDSMPRVTLVGFSDRISERDAAFLNSLSANALDFDDDNGVGHPSATVFPAALALAEMSAISPRDFILGYVLGYEVSTRVGQAIWPSSSRISDVWGIGTHQTFGSCIAAGKLLGLSESQLNNAMGIAGTLSPVPSALQWGWECPPISWLKDCVALPAQNGVTAARLAQKGFEGCKEIFDGPHGFWIMAGSDQFDPSFLTFGKGYNFAIERGGIKPFPCCRFMHTALQCLQKIMAAPEWNLDHVSAIEIRTISDAVKLLANPHPLTAIDAQFSFPYVVTTMARGVPSAHKWFYGAGEMDEKFQQSLRKVRLLSDPDADKKYQIDSRMVPATVDVVFLSGKRLSHKEDFPPGEIENPMADNEIIKKFISLSRPIIGESSTDDLLSWILRLDEQPDLGQLFRFLRPPVKTA